MEKEIKEKLCSEVEDKIDEITNEGVNIDNINMLDKLVDIHKDLKNEDYWEEKIMRYRTGNTYRDDRDYSAYNGRRRDSRGRYMGDMRKEPIEEMYDNYETYMEGKKDYSRGNYGAKEDTMKALEYMLESMVDFVSMLKDDAMSEDEMNLIRKYTRKVAEM